MAENTSAGSYHVKKEEMDFKPMFFENNDDNSNCKFGVSIAERRAEKCGFDASNINGGTLPTVRLPYFTVSPGISPSALLDSPMMLPNAQAQLSPTTGTFQFTSPCHESLKLKLKLANTVATESSSTPNPQVSPYSISSDGYGESKCPRDVHLARHKSWPSEVESMSIDYIGSQIFGHNKQTPKQMPTSREKHHKGPPFPKELAKYSEDGYFWRKYGQKQVKGSEYPRSYFKCTNANCLVKKKVERSHDGQITEIEYKGSHNHPKPMPLKRFSESSEINDGSMENNQDAITFGSDWRTHDAIEGTSSTSFPSDFSDQMSKISKANEELSSTFNSDQNGIDQPSPDSVTFSSEYDESCEPKRRKRESFPSETTVSRSTREPRVVVQIESEIDILDDGYRWRKYGQKVVKGNPNPRSYYKCTTPGCPVRKHVERAADDIKSVITTYEGKHNHEVPCSKNASLIVSDTGATNRTLSVQMGQKQEHVQKKQPQDLHMYTERKPILTYNEFMRSNLPGHDLNFGTSSIYPLSYPPLPSMPYSSLLTNGNHHHHHHRMNTYPPPNNMYPSLQDYMTLPSPMNHHVLPLAGNFQVNSYHPAMQHSVRGQDIQECQPKIVKPKEEQRDEAGMYNACLSNQIHRHGTI